MKTKIISKTYLRDIEKYELKLYLDITYFNKDIEVIDEDELLESYHNHEFTKEELDNIYKTKDRLIKEIETGTNECMQIDYLKYIETM